MTANRLPTGRLRARSVPALVAVLLSTVALPAAAQGPTGSLIFPLEHWHNHGSSIVELPNGDLLVAWFHGSGERRSDDVRIMGARRRAGGTVWSEPFLLADTPGFPDTNCTLLLEPVSRGRPPAVAVLADDPGEPLGERPDEIQDLHRLRGARASGLAVAGRAPHEARRRLPRPGGGEDGRVLPEPGLRRTLRIQRRRSRPGNGPPATWSRPPTS